MKVHICSLVFLALLASATALSSCPLVDGHYAVSVANSDDCGSFYACSSGKPLLTLCPAGLQYNEVLGICDWAENANCITGGTEDSLME